MLFKEFLFFRAGYKLNVDAENFQAEWDLNSRFLLQKQVLIIQLQITETLDLHKDFH